MRGMNCEAARLLIGGDPHTHYAEVAEHIGHCEECAEFRNATLAFATVLTRALSFAPVSPVAASRATARRAFKQPRRWGVGIGLAAALITGFLLWLAQPPETLAAQVMNHVANEPGSWSQTVPIPAAEVRAALRAIGSARESVPFQVVYARNCDFRRHKVAHLVILTRSGPVTVFIDPLHRPHAIRTLRSGTVRGLIMPLDGMSVAVLSESESALREAASGIEFAAGIVAG